MFKKFLDFHFYKVNFIAILVLFFSILYIKCFNIQNIEENSVVENLQLIALGFCFVFCFFAKNYKTFFRFIAIIIFLMFLREINYGRVIFCQVDGNPHLFYPWSHYKYGFLSDFFVGAYIIAGLVYAFVNKIWIDIFEIIKKIKFPFWTFLGSFLSVFVQIYSENCLHSTVIEETSEFVLYCLIFAVIYIYSKKIEKIAQK